MPETAETHMVTLTTNRNCVIEIKNFTSNYCLWKPKVHMESGFSHSPPTPTLRTTMSEVCSFTKDDNTPSGAVGVMTYELFSMRERRCTEQVAVMFSVPFDYNIYKNWLGLGIFENSKECDDKLFNYMYNDKEFADFVRHDADGTGLVYRGKNVDLRATMSDEGRAIVKLDIFDKM